jgi:hypothetical protein
MTEHAAGSAQEPQEVIPPVPVQVGHDLNVQGQAADFGSWFTYVTAAAGDQARPILPMEPARHRATVMVASSAVAGAGVWVGTMAQVQAAIPLGGWLSAGASVVVENNQALFLIGDGANSLKVSVLQERWDSGES